jgi:two-component sensor histidine kinase
VVVELAIGLALPLLMLLLRLPLSAIAGDRAPYAFMFLGAALATLLAGWRSGVLAVFVGQLLTWYFVVQPAWSFGLPSTQVRAALILATLSQLLTVLIIALYQREIDKGTAERERRLSLLDEALKEIDHRTRNNYQTVLALIDLQSRRATEPGVQDALRQVAERIQAVANASQRLAANSADLAVVRLDDHLCGLVEQIGRGLTRDGIDVDCEVEEVTASPEKATSISIIVNELVTNAIKHAFNGEGSGHVIVTGRHGSDFELIVTDNGRGLDGKKNSHGTGLGARLVESFVRQLGARHEVESSERGTTHKLLIPSLD